VVKRRDFYHGRDLLLPKCYDASADTFDFVGIFSVLVKIISYAIMLLEMF
jgi:hypothetical protein